jgi:hypothetical protein
MLTCQAVQCSAAHNKYCPCFYTRPFRAECALSRQGLLSVLQRVSSPQCSCDHCPAAGTLLTCQPVARHKIPTSVSCGMIGTKKGNEGCGCYKIDSVSTPTVQVPILPAFLIPFGRTESTARAPCDAAVGQPSPYHFQLSLYFNKHKW